MRKLINGKIGDCGSASGGPQNEQSLEHALTRMDSNLSLSDTSTQHEGPAIGSPLGKVFGVDELAIFFGCSKEKIKRRARDRELPAFKFGKSWYVREQDLEQYINSAVESNSRWHQERR